MENGRPGRLGQGVGLAGCARCCHRTALKRSSRRGKTMDVVGRSLVLALGLGFASVLSTAEPAHALEFRSTTTLSPGADQLETAQKDLSIQASDFAWKTSSAADLFTLDLETGQKELIIAKGGGGG